MVMRAKMEPFGNGKHETTTIYCWFGRCGGAASCSASATGQLIARKRARISRDVSKMGSFPRSAHNQ
jgi:hypothetical protein